MGHQQGEAPAWAVHSACSDRGWQLERQIDSRVQSGGAQDGAHNWQVSWLVPFMFTGRNMQGWRCPRCQRLGQQRCRIPTQNPPHSHIEHDLRSRKVTGAIPRSDECSQTATASCATCSRLLVLQVSWQALLASHPGAHLVQLAVNRQELHAAATAATGHAARLAVACRLAYAAARQAGRRSIMHSCLECRCRAA